MARAASADKFYLERRMRHFVYLSSAKLAPLYDWIGEPVRKRIALTLGISLPLLPVKLEAQVQPSSTSEAGMLSIVLAHLDGEGDIGTVDEPRGYFAGRLELRWGAATEFLFLSGSTQLTLVALTGSMKNLKDSGAAPRSVSLPGSSRIGASRTLDQILADAERQKADEDDTDLIARLAVMRRQQQPKEALEFVARKLAYKDVYVADHDFRPGPDFQHLKDRRVKVLHGTPLYLAYID